MKQVEGFEKPIKILLSPIEGSANIYVKIGTPPTATNYTWTASDNLIVIDPKTDIKFSREGTYYVLVAPKATFWDLFKAKQ